MLHFHNPRFQVHHHKLLAVWAAVKIGISQSPNVHTKRQPRTAIWSLIIGSFSMSLRNFLTSLILTHREFFFSIFTFFVQFTLSVCSIIHFVNNFISSLVHPFMCPLCNLPFSVALFKHSRFLCCSVASFGVSATSPKNSSCNIFSTSTIFFIKCRNRQHT